jgi:hypothetical protein
MSGSSTVVAWAYSVSVMSQSVATGFLLGECKVSPSDHFAAAAREAERSPAHRQRIDRLRDLAAGADRDRYSRDTGPLTAYGFGQLLELAEQVGGRRHVKDYIAGCRTDARVCLLAAGTAVDVVADRVHELVKRSAYDVDTTGIRTDRAWPSGPTASSLAAAVAGASWGSGATAQRQLSREHRSDLSFIL